MTEEAKKISVIGLGKLGSCMAAVYASKGHDVIGCDINPLPVETLNQGRSPVSETHLQSFIDQSRDRLVATTDLIDAVRRSSITFIIVPTPSLPGGKFSVGYVQAACRKIGEAFKIQDGYHLVVLTSTLLPGDCEADVISTLEQHSGKSCGKDFGFCYSPLFIAIGSVINNLLHPDFFLVGEFDKQSGDLLESFYRSVCDNEAPVRRMSIPSAELTKISINSYITMKITFANMLGEVAEHIWGVDIDDVTGALGSDRRIGSAYLRSGLGYGGPCFPRDNRAFAQMALSRGVHAPFAHKTDEYNRSIIQRLVRNITSIASTHDVIAIVGTSYKPGTAFAEESQAIDIARALTHAGYTVHVHNPDGNDHTRLLLGNSVSYHDELNSCLEQADVVFLGLPMAHVLEHLKQSIKIKDLKVIDPWRQWKGDVCG